MKRSSGKSKCTGRQMIKTPKRFADFGRLFVIILLIFFTFIAVSAFVNGRSVFSQTKNLVSAGYEDLKKGLISLVDQDFTKASQYFSGSEAAFGLVNKKLEFLTSQANQYLEQNLYLDTAQSFIESGIAVSRIGQELTAILDDVQIMPQVILRQNYLDDSSIKLTDLLNLQNNRLRNIIAKARLVKENLSEVNLEVLPVEIRGQVAEGSAYIDDFLAILESMEYNFKAVLTMLGDDVPHRYLVLFQNNHELRATGGFIGSYMILDVNDGAITKMEVKDVYETDGQLTKELIAPPGISEVADRLYMRDANYSPDFVISANLIMWLLEHSNGPSVDTVVAIDQTVAEKFLKLIGLVELEGFSEALSAENFNDLMSFHVESKLAGVASPKQMLIDFIPLLKERFLNLNGFSDVVGVVLELIDEQHIQMYSVDESIQRFSQYLAADGRMPVLEPGVDFLAIITTSIGGNKSDAFIKMSVEHNTVVEPDGGLVDQLMIEKTHTWQEEDFSVWRRLIGLYGTGELSESTLRFIHGEGENVDYMRVYVPLGSELIGAEGVSAADVETHEDLGYTVFAFTFGPVIAGEAETVSLSYRLPFGSEDFGGPENASQNYQLIHIKQAGREDFTLKKTSSF